MQTEITTTIPDEYTTRFREGYKQTGRGLITMAQVAGEVRDTFGYQPYIAWLKASHGVSQRTGDRLLCIFENLLVTAKLAVDEVDQIAPSAIHLLANDSTPDEIRDQFIEQAKSGEPVSHAEVKAAVTAAKPQTVRVVASEIGEDESEKQGVIPQKAKYDPEEVYERTIGDSLARAREREAAEGNAKPTPSETFAQLQDIIATGKRFGCVYADPAWQYGNQATRAATDNHYDTMSVDDICALPVKELAEDNAHLHLWTTNAFLFDARRVMEAWGFEYKSVMVWVKPQMGIGNYWRVSHEFLLFGIRGRAPFGRRDVMSWQQVDRQKHSCKPDVFRRLVEQVSPGPYLEMFARQAMPGWTAWGNEVEQGMFIDALAG